MASQCIFIAVALYLLANFEPPRVSAADMKTLFVTTAPWAMKAAEAFYLLKIIAPVVVIPAFFMGFAYPLANAHVQDAIEGVGSKAGSIYLANMLGAVLGAFGAGFVLLPLLGMQSSIEVLLPLSLVSIILLALSANPPRRRGGRENETESTISERSGVIAASICGLLLCVSFFKWNTFPDDYLLLKTFIPYGGGKEKVISTSEGVIESIVITEKEATGQRTLYTNGHNMSDTGLRGQRYMRAFAHIPLLQLKSPKSALVICFGVGNTLHAASLHPSIETLEIVDTSRHVLEHAHYFRRTNADILNDPRVSVFVNDGRLHLRMTESDHYDLITLEAPPIKFAGVSALYSREFYKLARQGLKQGGFLTQWLPSSQVSGYSTMAIVKAFIEVFPNAVLLSGSYDHLILMGRKGAGIELDPRLIGIKMAQAPQVKADMDRITWASAMEIAGSFVASSRTMNRAAAAVTPVSDDYPSMEYDVLYFKAQRGFVWVISD